MKEEKTVTLKKYMWLDILILTILGILMDVVAYFITSWIAETSIDLPIIESVFIAPSFTIMFLIYYRWKDKGFVSNVVFLVLQLILYKEQIFVGYQYPLMIIGSYMMFGLTYFTVLYSEKLKIPKWFYLSLSFILIYGIMFSTEYLIGTLFGLNISYLGVVLRHTTNLVLCILIIIIMAVQKNLVTDMKTHLINQSKEED